MKIYINNGMTTLKLNARSYSCVMFYNQTNYIANLLDMLCCRCVRLVHCVQEMMHMEDAMAFYSHLVRV